MGPPGTTPGLVTWIYTHKNAQAHKLHSYIMLDYLGCIYIYIHTKNVTSYKVMFFFGRASLAHWECLLRAEAFNDLQGDYADAVLPFDHAGRGAAGGWIGSRAAFLQSPLGQKLGTATPLRFPHWTIDVCISGIPAQLTAVSPYPLILIRASLLKPFVR